MALADILLNKDTNMTLAQAKEAEQALLRYFEILYQIHNKEAKQNADIKQSK